MRSPSRLRHSLLAAAVACLLTACGEQVPQWEEKPPNILLLVIDTLRADAVGAYGSRWESTPFLDSFSREGIVFERAFAPTPQTAPSHATLFTSTHPATHGIWNEVYLGPRTVPGRPRLQGRRVLPALPKNAITLAEVLAGAGYETAAIADGGWVIRERGFRQGFKHFDSSYVGVVNRVGKAMDWLERRDDDRPFFLFLHTYQVHAPYLPPLEYEKRFAGDYRGPLREVLLEARKLVASGEVDNVLAEVDQKLFKPLESEYDDSDARFLRSLYQAELALVDDQVRLLMDQIRSSGQLDDTIVVITSDHGEEFGEHGSYGHGQLYGELLRIPLIIRGPGAPAGLRRSDPVGLADVMPTLLSRVGLEIPPSAVGDVLDFGPAEGDPDRMMVGEVRWRSWRQLAAQIGDLKSVFYYGDRNPRRSEVFDTSADPEERNSLSSTEVGSEYLERSKDLLDAWIREAEAHRDLHDLQRSEHGLDEYDERMDELRALGYIED